MYARKIILLSMMIQFGSLFAQFIENKGQWDQQALARGFLPDGFVFIENRALTYVLHNSSMYRWGHNALFNDSIRQHGTDKLYLHAFKLKLIDANTPDGIEKFEKLPQYYNFFVGNNPEKWVSGANAFYQYYLKEVYPGIDWKIYYDSHHHLKYDFIVKPGNDPGIIRWHYEGVEPPQITSNGHILIHTEAGDVIEQKPYAYQMIDGKKIEVECRFERKKNYYFFKTGSYDKKKALYIDPVLIFASYSGSTADNFGMTATYDKQGLFITGGMAYNMGYPTTLGAYDVTFNGTPGPNITDVVISKFNANGSNLIFSTYLGGTSTETAQSLIVDSLNNVLVFGITGSSDFPVTSGAYDTTFGGGSGFSVNFNGVTCSQGSDIYIAKLNANGTSLLASTFFGGSNNDGINYHASSLPYNSIVSYDSLTTNYGDQFRGEIIIDKWNNVYIASCTRSANLPMVNAFQNNIQGAQDAIVAKFNPGLSNLLFSTYLGGVKNDAAYSIKVDTNGIMYVAGGTSSSNFPTTAGVISTTYNGGKADGFIAKLDSNGTLLASTFIGTNVYDQVFFIDIDKYKNIYFVGQSLGNMPVTPAGVYNNPNSKQFVQKINNSLSSLIYSTVFGNGNNSINISPAAFMVDRCQNVYISGWGANILQNTPLTNMPLTSNAIQTTSDGFDFYLIVFERDLQSLLYAGPFGGNISREHVDGGTSRFSKEGVVYQSVCGGCGGNSDFPTTTGAWSNTNNSSNCNNAVFQLDFQIQPKASFEISDTMGCVPFTIQFTNTSTNGSQFIWIFGDGDTSYFSNPVKTYTDTGVFEVKLLLYDSICEMYDTIKHYVYVGPQLQLTVMNDTALCNPASINIWASGNGTNQNFIFSSNNQFTDTLNNYPNDTIISVNINQDTIIYIKHFNEYCELIDSVVINVVDLKAAFSGDTIICVPDTVYFQNLSSDYDSLQWIFPVPTYSLSPPYAVFNQPGNYTVKLVVFNESCGGTDTATLNINALPQVQISTSNDTLICSPYAQLQAGSNQSNVQFIWSSNNQWSDTLSTSNILILNADTGSHLYYVLVSNGVCSTYDSIIVSYKPIFADLKDTVVCNADEVQLNAAISGYLDGLQIQWSPASEIISGSNTNQPLVNADQTQTFAIVVSNAFGCKDSADATLYSFQSMTDNFTVNVSQDTIFQASEVCMSVHPIPAGTQIVWQPSNAFTNPNSDQVCTIVQNTTTFHVIITDSNGCSVVKIIPVIYMELPCGEPNIYIPNAFTPNGDGENDVLYIRGRNIASIEWFIFDRWGEKVFESYDISKGWDGTYKGKPVDPDVYVYHLKIDCGDGQKTFMKGNVSVLK